jgi:hypothetical protein
MCVQPQGDLDATACDYRNQQCQTDDFPGST